MFRFVRSALVAAYEYVIKLAQDAAATTLKLDDMSDDISDDSSEYVCSNDSDDDSSYDDSLINDFIEIKNRCRDCGEDISNQLPHHIRCDTCWHESRMNNDFIDNDVIVNNDEILTRKCVACSTEFTTTRGLNKRYCARRGCPGLARMTPRMRADAHAKLSRRGYSDKAIVWLTQRAKRDGVVINHALNGGERAIRVGGATYHVDGYAPTTNTIYEFYGDLYHGNPEIYAQGAASPVAGKTYGELHAKTIAREAALIGAGYNVIAIWESEYDRGMV